MSPTLFNIFVDSVISTYLSMIVEYHRVDHNELGEAFRRCLRVFYSDDGMVISRYPDWIRHSMLVGLFRRYFVVVNVSKSLLMMCQPSVLRLGISAEAKALKCTGMRIHIK